MSDELRSITVKNLLKTSKPQNLRTSYSVFPHRFLQIPELML